MYKSLKRDCIQLYILYEVYIENRCEIIETKIAKVCKNELIRL